MALFLLAIFWKYKSNSVIKHNAVTRNLFMQFVPSITWLLSLCVFYAVYNVNGDGNYGESWNSNYDIFRLFGFIIVFIGSFLYMKHKK